MTKEELKERICTLAEACEKNGWSCVILVSADGNNCRSLAGNGYLNIGMLMVALSSLEERILTHIDSTTRPLCFGETGESDENGREE